MQVYRVNHPSMSAALPPPMRGAVAAIGNFDGVHKGHQAVIEHARRLAQACAAPLAVISFEPHPRAIIAPDQPPARLTALRQKIQILQGLNVDCLIVIRFTKALMAHSAEEFIDALLIDRLALRGVVSGPNFYFGHKRGGNPAMLAAHMQSKGRLAAVADPLKLGDEFCSSSRIRSALEAGDVALAEQMLGRPYQIDGMVKPGEQRGRTIGFPTANVHPLAGRLARGQTLLPAHGVYAVQALTRAGDALPAVANLGRRPTFDGRTTLLEVHLFDFTGDLYGKRLGIQFIERIRAEQKFSGIDALRGQIAQDSAQAKRILGHI